MEKQGESKPSGKLFEAITKTYRSFEEFKMHFSEAGITRFDSGWAWLCLDDAGILFICSTSNQDDAFEDLAERKGIPLLTIDVWEHAYSLKYQNKRADYLDSFWNIISWEEISKRYENALKSLRLN